MPSAFQRPDHSAILRADRGLWTRAAGECRSNLKVGADGKLPLDEAMLNLYQTAPVLFFLLPLPKAGKVRMRVVTRYVQIKTSAMTLTSRQRTPRRRLGCVQKCRRFAWLQWCQQTEEAFLLQLQHGAWMSEYNKESWQI